MITTKDVRFSEYGLANLLANELSQENIEVYEWNHEIGDDNITLAERANVGITFSEMTLAESATVVLFTSQIIGKSVSLLPTTYIAIVPKHNHSEDDSSGTKDTEKSSEWRNHAFLH